MGGHEAKALQSGNSLYLPHQRRQAALTIGVAVVVDVLADQHHLSGSLGHGLAALRHDRGHRHVLLAASDAGDDAERAVVVASLDDAYKVADAGATGGGERRALPASVTRARRGD